MALGNDMLSFIFDPSKGETPRSIALKRELAARLMGTQNPTPRNAGEGWGSLLSSVGNGIAANVMNRRAQKAETEGNASAGGVMDEIRAKLTGDYGAFPAAPGGQSASAGDVASQRVAQAYNASQPGGGNYRDAIASIESDGSGGYSAVGPTNKKLGRALGRYQVMEANIGPWSKEALGREISAQEFMDNPKYQDAIFDHRFGSYVNKYGNPQDAASAWFTGQPLSKGAGRKDVLGTTGAGYVDKFTRALGDGPVAANEAMAMRQPVQMASLDPSMMPQQQGGPMPPPMPIQQPQPPMGPPGGPMAQGGPMPMQQPAAPPMPPPRPIADMPVAQPQPPQQMAQAQGQDLSQIPGMAGGTSGALQPGMRGGIDMATLMKAASNPFLNEGQRSIVNSLLQQQMQAQDPGNQLDMEYKRAQIDALGRKGDGNDETFFGNPVAIQGPDGKMSYGQMGNKGTFRPIALPDGQSFAPPTKTIDTGTETLIVDQAGNVISRTPKQNYQESFDTAAGAADGKTKSEVNSEYDSISSKMPGLYSVVDRLQGLAKTATYTAAGKIFDATGRELGAEPREGAVARAEYTAIVDNQILPLLRDTFGAQFTAEEGARLARTLGDPDKSPTEKSALLRAFIGQKERDIAALGSRLGKPAESATPSGAPSKPYSEMTNEELEAIINGQ